MLRGQLRGYTQLYSPRLLSSFGTGKKPVETQLAAESKGTKLVTDDPTESSGEEAGSVMKAFQAKRDYSFDDHTVYEMAEQAKDGLPALVKLMNGASLTFMGCSIACGFHAYLTTDQLPLSIPFGLFCIYAAKSLYTSGADINRAITRITLLPKMDEVEIEFGQTNPRLARFLVEDLKSTLVHKTPLDSSFTVVGTTIDTKEAVFMTIAGVHSRIHEGLCDVNNPWLVRDILNGDIKRVKKYYLVKAKEVRKAEESL